LRTQVAVALTETVQTALIPREQKGLKIDPRTQALQIKAAAVTKNPRRFAAPEARRNWEQVVARAPQFAHAHAGVALSLMYATTSGPPGEQLAYRRRARQEAETAIRIDPRAGAAGYDALYMVERLEAPGDLARAEDRLLEGLAKSPYPPLHMRECQFLIEIGRVKEGVAHCTRAFTLDPLHAPIHHRYAHALYASGETEAAAAAIARAFRNHPDQVQVRRVRREIAVFGGAPDKALALLRSEEAADVPRKDLAGMEPFLAARKSGAPQDVDRAMESLWAAARAGGDPRYLVMAAAVLGRKDDAFAALATPGFVFNTETGFLFTPATEPLRRDPRFLSVAAKRGLVRYWKQRGVWPDFCSDQTLPYDCRKEAARVAPM
jgi:tetratricopeptide (TPR) repeat protein